MPVSGNIKDTIQFNLTDAVSVTGVKFGSGQANFSTITETALDATVPQTATYGKVTFQKRNSIEVFDITATGDGDSNAYSALTGQINSLGYYESASGCTTGSVSFSQNYTASGVCVITTTGTSSSGASGEMVNAHSSGFCGGPTGFTSGSYTVSETRLNNVSVNQLGNNTNYVAVGLVEYTGNFNVKKASVTVTCDTPQESETDYNFVPVSRINNFTVLPSGGGKINIFGNALTSVTGVNIGTGANIPFSGGNTTITGDFPTGNYEDFLHFHLYSGLSVLSSQKYITSGELSGANKEEPFAIVANQKITSIKNQGGNAIINGSGLNGIDSIKFVSKQSLEKTPFTSSSTKNQIVASLAGLETGLHDFVVTKSGVSLTGVNFIQILDNVTHSYGYETFMSSGVSYLGEESTESELSGILNSFIYGILTTGDASRISFNISGNNISSGDITFSLSKKSNVTKTVNSLYYIKGFATSSGESVTKAYDKFNSGIYSEGEFGDYDPSSSYKISDRVCDITNQTTTDTTESKTFKATGTHTGEITGSPLDLNVVLDLQSDTQSQWTGYTGTKNLSCSISSETVTSGVIGTVATGSGIYISQSGFNSGENLIAINNRISDTGDYSGYNLISTTTEIINNNQTYSYSSGISFPFSASDINDTSSQSWVNILNSGLNDLYPAGWTGQDSLNSGVQVVTGASAGSTTVTFSGKTTEEVNNLIGEEQAINRSYCSTGDPSYYLTGEIVNLTEIKFFSGYC